MGHEENLTWTEQLVTMEQDKVKRWAQTIALEVVEAVENSVVNMTVNVAAWQATVHPEGKTTLFFMLIPSETCKCFFLIFRLFLKCKHTTGSGSGGAGHNCNSKDNTEKSQQLAINLKAVLGELEERKEDFEKLKQKLERLEVSSNKPTTLRPQGSFNVIFLL